jgi:hypothetical protein
MSAAPSRSIARRSPRPGRPMASACSRRRARRGRRISSRWRRTGVDGARCPSPTSGTRRPTRSGASRRPSRRTGGAVMLVHDGAIWIMSARAGRLLRHITSDGEDVDFSPDGRRLAYHSAFVRNARRGGTGGGDLYIADVAVATDAGCFRNRRSRTSLPPSRRTADRSPGSISTSAPPACASSSTSRSRGRGLARLHARRALGGGPGI